jgi:acetamidase/formamidase
VSSIATSPHLGRTIAHHFWDKTEPPQLVVEPGDVIDLELRDGSNGQITPTTVAADLHSLHQDQMDPLTGPIWVTGAVPGDAISVEILDIRLGSWGWSGILPGFGLLADQFPDTYIRGWDTTGDTVEIAPGHTFALRPMLGVIGVAPPDPGRFASTVPTNAGGNIDVKYARTGSSILLPVFNEGALLSLGDAHALQGDGELSGTAIECEADVTLRIGLVKGAELEAPVIDTGIATDDPTERHRVFLGVGSDLFQAARAASSRAVDAVSSALELEPHVAYALLGTIAELRINEVVDRPNWVVGCLVPSRLFK